MNQSTTLADQSHDFFLTTCRLANASQQTFCRYMISRKAGTTLDQEMVQSMLSILQFLSSLQAFLYRQHYVLRGSVLQKTTISLADALSKHFESHFKEKTEFTFNPSATEYEPKQTTEQCFSDHTCSESSVCDNLFASENLLPQHIPRAQVVFSSEEHLRETQKDSSLFKEQFVPANLSQQRIPTT